LIASRRDWYQSKGLLKGFKLALRPWESSKNWWRYDQMKFVTECRKCGQKECHVEENRGLKVIRDRQKWCECIEEVARPREAKAQQSSAWSKELESTAKEGGSVREPLRGDLP